ncbi:negative transcriptional regulator [Aspergillus violaceofuscus CBS 115571]|uniref:Negative transcriptional regulator n=1 Tax=Aspergillus violaceofuscus (strain CBS 115571) TaxID=1450538 RepID=A0A2V5I5R0_ASPV1|nr:negative transcriptional regulator [Aspergillus violaceofuscus CBS 115571]
MFIPSVHAETDTEALLQFIHDNPLGLLITGIPSSVHDFLQCTHVPFVLDPPTQTEPARLRAHIAKQNPQVKALLETAPQNDNNPTPEILTHAQEVLVVFTGSHHHYVTPKFYTQTKPDTGKVVPTWNYAAVQVYGKLSVYYDSRCAKSGQFLAKQMRDLSARCERGIMGFTGEQGRQGPWTVEDAPERYIELMQRNIVGVEIEVCKVEGKVKMSQEMRKGDREGVVRGFAGLGGETGTVIAELVRERGEMAERKKGL